ncbi:hypothetical protein CAPI_01420 [Corynebacterium capitovis DSM 44611]|uniref:hypothetical protein n=1 Tax=Corynebacterium capitovis TaxID=131081 RepID=UPI000363191F|nr:hypothetical protein [Corynebacterium capitovis]WKD56858.1 hypothetical protein CAPI_01420 [Corynebacterium capitovis DSM 44611]
MSSLTHLNVTDTVVELRAQPGSVFELTALQGAIEQVQRDVLDLRLRAPGTGVVGEPRVRLIDLRDTPSAVVIAAGLVVHFQDDFLFRWDCDDGGTRGGLVEFVVFRLSDDKVWVLPLVHPALAGRSEANSAPENRLPQWAAVSRRACAAQLHNNLDLHRSSRT